MTKSSRPAGVFAVSLGLVLVLAAITPAFAAGASISGTVTDQNKAPLEGATVRVVNRANGDLTTTQTDQAGRYSLRGLGPGSICVTADADGFAGAVRYLLLNSNGDIKQDFVLTPGIIKDAITVTAGKGTARVADDTPQPVTISDRSDVEARRPSSTLQVAGLTPNLIPVNANPVWERPQLRGLDSNRVLVLIDGQPLNNVRSDPQSGVSPGVLDLYDLLAMEVISGAGSSLYGSDAMAGTINLVTRPAEISESSQRLSFSLDSDLHTNGLFRRAHSTLGWSTNKLGVRVAGSLFKMGDYADGGGAIPLSTVAAQGSFANRMATAVGDSVANTYGVWSLPSRANVANGQGQGFNDEADIRFVPSDHQEFHYSEINSQHKDLGFPLIAPPFDTREEFTGFRRLDKYAVRYEARDLAPRLPRLSASFYWQKYSFADDNYVSNINEGSSWTMEQGPGSQPITLLTGNPSAFTLANFTDGKSSLTSIGADADASFAPFRGALITSGAGYLRESSHDDFSVTDFGPGSVAAGEVTGRTPNPDSIYQDLGWFNLIEVEARKWLLVTGGLRIDNWRTEARVTPGFPIGTEATVLAQSLPQLDASPGQIDLAGLSQIADLTQGVKGINTNNTVATGNAGLVLRLRHRINPYFRWGTSYREPGITERYTLRDFGTPTFSVIQVPNTVLKPETGQGYEGGVKARGDRWDAAFGYFRNDYANFLETSLSPTLFIPADPALGIDPISPDFPFHGVELAQRTNTAKARIQGLESSAQFGIPAGRAGTVTPYESLGWLKGTNLSPDAATVLLLEQFYNKPGTPAPLKGSPSDAPLTNVPGFRGIFGARYDSKGGIFADYEVRYQSRVERVDPEQLITTILTQYGSFASLNSFAVQSVRGGYTFRREKYRVMVTAAVENLTDRLYFEQFLNAPAPGRSFVFGLSLDFINLLSR
jgi:hemoglobin/transferrin/lactoferrin receptor protein